MKANRMGSACKRSVFYRKVGITYASFLSDAHSVSEKRRFSLGYAGIARIGWTGLHKDRVCFIVQPNQASEELASQRLGVSYSNLFAWKMFYETKMN